MTQVRKFNAELDFDQEREEPPHHSSSLNKKVKAFKARTQF